MDGQGAAQKALPEKGEPHTASSITLPGILPLPEAYLKKHGCEVFVGKDEVTIFYPEGTTRRELYPVTLYMRYEVTLPDVTVLRESYPIHPGEGNYLYLPKEAIEQPCSGLLE